MRLRSLLFRFVNCLRSVFFVLGSFDSLLFLLFLCKFLSLLFGFLSGLSLLLRFLCVSIGLSLG